MEANRPARLLARLREDELRERQIADLSPPDLLATIDHQWARLLATGCVAGEYEAATPDGGSFRPAYCVVANVLPERHLGAFAPLGWSEDELGEKPPEDAEVAAPLTPRELEVLQLAADGHTGPHIADELVVSLATVRTHFENIYAKLGVSDRPAAVAKAMRMGLIA